MEVDLYVISNKADKTMCAYLGALRVASLLNLVWPLLCEADAEHAQQVAVSGPNVDVRLDQGLPLLHHRPQLVRR